MSDFLDLTGKKSEMQIQPLVPVTPVADIPQYATLQDQLAEASLLVDDIVLKNHLTHLTSPYGGRINTAGLSAGNMLSYRYRSAVPISQPICWKKPC